MGVGSAADEGGGKARPRSGAPIVVYIQHSEPRPSGVGGVGGSGSLINTNIFTINLLNIHDTVFI